MVSQFAIQPIGWVHSPVKEVADDCWGGVVSTIELDPAQFTPAALQGLTEFSHVEVLFHLNRIEASKVTRGARHPRNSPDWPESGIFAQRAKDRPNQIAVTVCRLLSVKGMKLTVSGLDAVDGSPVIDLKPYFLQFHPRPEEVKQPRWVDELMQNYFQKKK